MSQPTRAVSLTPESYAYYLDKLLIAGYDRKTVEDCLKLGDWSKLPVSQAELDRYTCQSCGKPPYKDTAGRLQMGCWGNCTQKPLADLQADAVKERARQVSLSIARERDHAPASRPYQRGMWMEDED